MELMGKKVAFLGDSITEGVGASSPKTCFVRVFARNEGALARNYGISATRIARQKDKVAFNDFQDFVSRVETLETDVDIVVVFGGTNDYGHGDAPFGSPEDATADTFCGACNVLFERLNERFPRAEKVALTPLGRASESTPPQGKRSLKEYAAVLKESALRHGWQVLDLYEKCKSDPIVRGVRENLNDGLHPNDRGHALLAEAVAAFLKRL